LPAAAVDQPERVAAGTAGVAHGSPDVYPLTRAEGGAASANPAGRSGEDDPPDQATDGIYFGSGKVGEGGGTETLGR
jgi:hypothetical protein